MGLDARFALAILGLLAVFIEVDVADSVTCPGSFSKLADDANCHNYVQCVFGQPWVMPCPHSLGFSTQAGRCVITKQSDCNKPKAVGIYYEKPPEDEPVDSDKNKKNHYNKNPNNGKPDDKPATTPEPTTEKPTTTEDATITTAAATAKTTDDLEESRDDDKPTLLRRSMNEECESNPWARFAHPTKCALFYDCRVIHKPVPKYFEQFMAECPYPQLFNDRTKRCDSYVRVTCGRRKEPSQACEYRQNWCQRAHCPPCHTRFPTCNGKPNGRNNWDGRDWTPYFSECKNGRLMEQGICDYSKGYPQLFSPESRGCVSILTVPKQYGGFQPSCYGKSNGFHPHENGCDVYFQCKRNVYRGTFHCPTGRVFDTAYSLCRYPHEVKGKCHDDSQQF